MELKFIEGELDSLGFSLIPLNAVHPDHNSYSILLNQCKGELKAEPDFVGNSDATHLFAIEKFVAFATIAHTKLYDLAVCPEYSCPWESLENIYNSDLLPSNSKLWIFGMESITPTGLKHFIDGKDKLIWLYDKDLINAPHEKRYLDPVCILFRAKSKSSDTEVTICAIQFKTSHMSVHDDEYRESDYLIQGKYIYVLKNPGSSTFLATLICSDSLIFNLNLLLDNGLEKLLLLHIQMNLDPRHTTFKKYRDDIFSNGELDKIEVLCLNWAKDSQILTHNISYSGSAYFYKPSKPVNEDHRLDENQNHGMFYSYWKNNRCHTIFFTSDEMLIGFHTDKTSQVLSATQLQRRKGPIGFENYVWDTIGYKLLYPISNAFKNHCDSLNCDLSPLNDLNHTNQERLIKLSAGLNLKKDSFDVTSFDFYIINDTEFVNRLTFTDEVDVTINQIKMDYLMKLKELIIIFKNKTHFPVELLSLTQNSKLHYTFPNNKFINVFSKESNEPIGTIVYIGFSIDKNAISIYDNLNKLYLQSIPPAQNKREMPKIIVWYHDGELKRYFKTNVLIDKNFEADSTSIDKD